MKHSLSGMRLGQGALMLSFLLTAAFPILISEASIKEKEATASEVAEDLRADSSDVGVKSDKGQDKAAHDDEAAYDDIEGNGISENAAYSMPPYEGLTEEGYTEDIWKTFFELYPVYSNEEGTGLAEGFEMLFMPYYSLTLSQYEHENVFGAWEIASFDEETGGYKRYGIYACVRELDELSKPVDEVYCWKAFEELDISPYYADFNLHTMTASVINGNTLRLHLKVDVTDSSGGSFGHVTYQLHVNNNYNSHGAFSTPYYYQNDENRAQPSRGQMTYNSFSSVGSSSPYGRRLKIDAYWDLSGDDLAKFAEGVSGRNNLYWAAGFLRSGEYSLSRGSLSVSNLQTCIKQASCSHSSKKYAQISGDSEKHSVSCASCGMAMGTQAHSRGSSGGSCSLCGYSFAVTGQLIYILNGRTEKESYTETPGASYIPKSFPGYKPPEEVIIPVQGGDIEINYEPISYTLSIGDRLYELLYDEELYLPREDIPGYIHEGYLLS